MTVREDKVQLKTGTPGIYSVVETPAAAGVLIVGENREITLVGQYRYPVQQYSWELVEGAVEEGETPLETAEREMKEEAGCTAKILRPLGEPFHLSNARSNELAYLFVAESLEFGESAPEESEELEVLRLPLARALQMVDEGEIMDSLSIVGLLRYAREQGIR